jgi:hypothetical protein
MARIKLGTVVTEASGKLAGHCFQHSHGGMQLRTKPIPSGKPSASQTLIRSLNPILQKGWQDLTDEQRKVWNLWPIKYDLCNKSGDRHPLSGHDLWMKYNYTWLAAGGGFLPDPSYWGGTIYGPELIVNGKFNGQSPWIGSPTWSFAAGKANYLDTNTAPIYQSVNYYSADTYRLSFDISNCAGTTGIRFIYPGQIHIFKPPYNVYFYLTNGSYIYEVSPVIDRDIFYISGSVTRNAFSIDNVSFRKIL